MKMAGYVTFDINLPSAVYVIALGEKTVGTAVEASYDFTGRICYKVIYWYEGNRRVEWFENFEIASVQKVVNDAKILIVDDLPF